MSAPPPSFKSSPPSPTAAELPTDGTNGATRPETRPSASFDPAPLNIWLELLLVVMVIAVVTAIGLGLPKSYYVQVGLVYLLVINVLSLRVGRWPIFTAGILVALAWDYFFVYPYFDFRITTGKDYFLLLIYLLVALIVGQSTARIRAQAATERRLKQQATALFQFIRLLTEARGLAEVAAVAKQQIDELLGAQTTLSFAYEGRHPFELNFLEPSFVDEQERPAAVWAFHHRQPAGRFTDMFPNCTGYYVPLVRESQTFGVLAVKLPPNKSLSPGQSDLLEAFARQLALIVEREHLRAASEREKILAESEKLHRALLESVSHELRTPLAVIMATCDKFSRYDAAAYPDFAAEIQTAGQRLTRLVGNLLDQTRLDSGALKAHMDWCDPHDLVNAAVKGIGNALVDRPLEITVAADMPLVRADFALVEHILVNLLLNAALHTPPGTAVSLTAGLDADGQRVFFAVADRGPGFPEQMRDQLFRKFVRGAGAASGGLGLGLSIVRGFATALGGEVVLGDNPGGGARITLYLPHKVANNSPPE